MVGNYLIWNLRLDRLNWSIKHPAWTTKRAKRRVSAHTNTTAQIAAQIGTHQQPQTSQSFFSTCEDA